MPCDTVQTTSVELSAANPELLRAALEQAGYTNINGSLTSAYHQATAQYVSIRNGSVRVRAGTESIVASIKQQYTIAALKKAAVRKSWRVQDVTPQSIKTRQ